MSAYKRMKICIYSLNPSFVRSIVYSSNMFILQAFLLATLLTLTQAGGITPTTRKSVSLYWGKYPIQRKNATNKQAGQNSYGKSTGPYVQQRLSYYCQSEPSPTLLSAIANPLDSDVDVCI